MFKYFLLAFSVSAFCACNNKTIQENTLTETPVISDSLMSTLLTEKVSYKEAVNEINLNGMISPDESRQSNVYALVSGKITRLSAELGDYVQRGQSLAVLNSAEVSVTNNDLAISEANLELAKKQLADQEAMFSSNLITSQDLLAAQMEFKKAVAEAEKTKNIASLTGGKNGNYTITSPLSGYIINKNITSGSEVRQDNNEVLFTVADLSVVWVIANVYESDIRHIRIGDTVSVHIVSQPDKNYKGTIDKIYNVLDPENRTMKVRITLPNTSNELKPGMFGTVTVITRGNESMARIPSASLIISDSKYYVVIQGEDKKLTTREIKLIKRSGDKAYISGVEAGEEVVTSSPLLIFEALKNL